MFKRALNVTAAAFVALGLFAAPAAADHQGSSVPGDYQGSSVPGDYQGSSVPGENHSSGVQSSSAEDVSANKNIWM